MRLEYIQSVEHMHIKILHLHQQLVPFFLIVLLSEITKYQLNILNNAEKIKLLGNGNKEE